MSTPAGRLLAPKAPERGVFPLDHFAECKQHMSVYMACLKQHAQVTERCRHLSRAYLSCRMERGLMAPDELAKLGFGESDALPPPESPPAAAATAAASTEAGSERGGFTAGLRRSQQQRAKAT